jgi:hypothetical protein
MKQTIYAYTLIKMTLKCITYSDIAIIFLLETKSVTMVKLKTRLMGRQRLTQHTSAICLDMTTQ